MTKYIFSTFIFISFNIVFSSCNDRENIILNPSPNLLDFSTNDSLPYVKIPDIGFEARLIAYKIDDVLDGKLLKNNAEKVTKLEFGFASNIISYKGIEAFKNLEQLEFNSCRPDKNVSIDLDISKNVKLTSLVIYNCQLTTINISKNTALKHLYYDSSHLVSLDVSNNKNLEYLHISSIGGDNPINYLDIGKNTALKSLTCSKTKIKNLDTSNNILLTKLDCSHNQLTSLDVSKCLSKDFELQCTDNKIQTICVNSLTQPKSNWQKDFETQYKVCR